MQLKFKILFLLPLIQAIAFGQADSVEAVGEEGSPILPQGPDWPSTVSAADHAASPLHAVVL